MLHAVEVRRAQVVARCHSGLIVSLSMLSRSFHRLNESLVRFAGSALLLEVWHVLPHKAEQCAQKVVIHHLHHEAEAHGSGADVAPHGATNRSKHHVRQIIRADREILEEVQHVQLVSLVVKSGRDWRWVEYQHINSQLLHLSGEGCAERGHEGLRGGIKHRERGHNGRRRTAGVHEAAPQALLLHLSKEVVCNLHRTDCITLQVCHLRFQWHAVKEASEHVAGIAEHDLDVHVLSLLLDIC
mmetsp:Transcript_20259/g.61045  ORF Transcript_20259/g.61045 Transcript_20259/m.61045 type:complete len:242 (+) Transcript_20259:426-1151(+)